MWSEAKTLWALATGWSKRGPLAERLENFYAPQAEYYDQFREKLLQGRKTLIHSLPFAAGKTWVDLGAGTGANLEFAFPQAATLSQIHLVDLCPSLLKRAKARVTERRWKNVTLHTGDVTDFKIREGVDIITFSYSLTMIPKWREAIDQAWSYLRPGGTLAVVDFFVATSKAEEPYHDWWTRNFWPRWFALDHIRLSNELRPYLLSRLHPTMNQWSQAKVPYLPLGRVPYFLLSGTKS